MPTFCYKKLVRDNIAQLHADEGHTAEVRILKGLELKQALKNKLFEEAAEVPIREVADKEVIEELADLQQIIDDLRVQYEITAEELGAVQAAKCAYKGGFSGGCYIEKVHMPNEDDQYVAYCRAAPHKYPEDEAFPSIDKGVYIHNKRGREYEVLGVSLQTETNQPLVVYRPLYDDAEHELYARPLEMFMETVTIDGKKVPRFEKIGSHAEG